MTRNLRILAAAFSIFALVGVGVLVDRFGYVEIRTNNSDRAITLSVLNPILLGVPVLVRWQGHEEMQDRAIELRMVHAQETVSFGITPLVAGLARIHVSCTSSLTPARIELVEQATGAILASAAVELLPPGPDCVR